VVIPDISSGQVKLPVGVYIRSPNKGDEAFPGAGSGLDRARIQQWNIAFERRLPMDVALEVAYVGTATDGGYADLNVNYGEPGRQRRAQVLRVGGHDRHQRLGGAHQEPLQGAPTGAQPAVQERADAQGRLHLEPVEEHDGQRRRRVDHPELEPPDGVRQELRLRRVRSDTRIPDGVVCELAVPEGQHRGLGKILGGWQVNGIFAFYTGTPFSITGSNTALNCQGCGNIFINVQGDPQPTGTGLDDRAACDKSSFSQPTGLTADGFGTSERNQFRRPSIWNMDLSLFKAFPLGRIRPELRIEAANIFNHTNWGAPILTYTANNFMQFTPSSTNQVSANTGDIPGARRITIGLRVGF
jgi:hypothetical protein